MSARQTPHSSGFIIPNNTLPHAHIHTHTRKLCTEHMRDTKEESTNTSHKAREQRATEPKCLGGWSVFISGVHLGWSRMMGIIITSLGSDSQY